MRLKQMMIALLLGGLILSACQSGSVEKSENENKNDEKMDQEEKDSSHDANDLEKIEGELWEADDEADVGVILSHGAAYDAESWTEQGEALADQGITAFATEDTSEETLLEAGEALKDAKDLDEVAILGASAGGGSAIEAVTKDEAAFDRVILLSPSGDARRIKAHPTLVIYSTDEGFDELEEADLDHLEAVDIPGDAHAQELFEDEKTADQVMKKIISFLKTE